MSLTEHIQFTNTPAGDEPFLHFGQSRILHEQSAANVYKWLSEFKAWEFTQTDFYTQYEFSVLHTRLPKSCQWLTEPTIIQELEKAMSRQFSVPNLTLTAVTAHKLTDGYKMGIHNDFIGSAETHRLIIQINKGWEPVHGGYLMLFYDNQPEAVSKIIQPMHNSAIGFEISTKSYHAVSTVHQFERYTIVYTFKQ